ncbi:hypothetical protein FIBSPDRAFT_903069 [Athelia psychrophila]|uniref:Uncharacterized protein n=1 Tax=Athelia psychrophila TaxID=1759441 RepID=A0A167WFI6_9AGAM|nr:hypothetical protein FIBSPDRAFT_903069 [Fibularhizoctonia sp. CBS 109695]
MHGECVALLARPMTGSFTAHIEKQLVEPRRSKPDLLTLETVNVQRVHAFKELRADKAGARVVFQAAGVTYVQETGSRVRSITDNAYYSSSFVPDTHGELMLHPVNVTAGAKLLRARPVRVCRMPMPDRVHPDGGDLLTGDVVASASRYQGPQCGGGPLGALCFLAMLACAMLDLSPGREVLDTDFDIGSTASSRSDTLVVNIVSGSRPSEPTVASKWIKSTMTESSASSCHSSASRTPWTTRTLSDGPEVTGGERGGRLPQAESGGNILVMLAMARGRRSSVNRTDNGTLIFPLALL